MKDKNGIEIRTGDVVRIEGGFFKNDNGVFRVERSPGDPGWMGSYHSLILLNKNGTPSTRKYNLGSWPIAVYTNSWLKRAEAKKHNAEHATIEVIKMFKKDGSGIPGWYTEV